ncbi:nicotinate-nucleotide--dimethylbenzimidazole phosphoribosyltransferase [Sphaerisporangium sp. TRM90804]|uniref:nicotinate-nucleotide--dimethylbenzimidazole phosphoribosyltransferase n=1 Tax=Sphaerisporangium sp. TRM90804 TaxID=3031113 RepID=UPI00244D3713|nr:nicotinate-nucleotide--dimethylbenzimidazole phosphoribosyltransferase [Sphaerisporangium sp. TRM90804]MDH2429726.1 nicotinate-nucleotide--dimethylbenzimidazole phosphoribosyltransferase [Sphaerisporangium sp. TRM90804]
MGTPTLNQTIAAIVPVDHEAMAQARAHNDRLTKPRGSLGAMEDVATRLAGIAGVSPPPLPSPAALAVFAADHGVHARGVSPWPQEVTAQMVANMVTGGAVANAFANQVGASVTVVDVGVAADLSPAPGLVIRKVAHGTADLSAGPAMTVAQAVAALEVGIAVARELVEAGAACLITGDMGIANTTASAALVCAFTGTDAAGATGRGTGIDAATLEHKIDVVRRALEANGLSRTRSIPPPPVWGAGRSPESAPAPGGTARSWGAGRSPDAVPGVGDAARSLGDGRSPDAAPGAGDATRNGAADPLTVLAAVGGLEHAAIAGFILGAAEARVPVILDGVIAGSAALAAVALAPAVVDYCVAGHRSAEPGHTVALRHLGLRPLVDLELRLGEGSGALLAYPLVGAAVRVLHEVATFDSAGVTGKDGQAT